MSGDDFDDFDFDFDFDFDLDDRKQFIATVILICLFLLLLGFFLVWMVMWLLKKTKQRKATKNIFEKSPVVVTSATHTALGGNPVPQQIPHQPGVYGANVYTPYPPPPQSNTTITTMRMPQAPYPAAPGMNGYPQMPMPMPMPQPNQQQYMNPPSYDVAVASAAPAPSPQNYEKQAPYNPHYHPQ